MIRHKAWFRIGLALGFLLTVLLASGYLAELLRYPSLWGNSDRVFNEYSSILPFGWSLAHYLTMIPLTLLVAGLPTWEKTTIERARWIALVLFIICLAGTLIYGNGRFHRIPFTLFYMVDLGTFLLLSLCFSPPVRLLAAGCGVALLGAATFALWPYLDGIGEEVTEPESAVVEKTREPDLLTPSDLILDKAQQIARYNLVVGPTVYPNARRLEEEICYRAQSLFLQMELEKPAPENFVSKVYLLAHPEFEPKRSIYWPYGTAEFVGGKWRCSIKYPAQPGADPAQD